jgi:hypothetical protein
VHAIVSSVGRSTCQKRARKFVVREQNSEIKQTIYKGLDQHVTVGQWQVMGANVPRIQTKAQAKQVALDVRLHLEIRGGGACLFPDAEK